jgi:hypothetical protein
MGRRKWWQNLSLHSSASNCRGYKHISPVMEGCGRRHFHQSHQNFISLIF